MLTAAAAVASALGGCADSGQRQLTADAFMPKPPLSVEAATPPSSQPSPPLADLDPPKKAIAMPAEPVPAPERPRPLDEAAPPPAAGEPTLASATATTQPSSEPAPTTAPAAELKGGLYMTVGGVVAEVNGTPIYANEILRKLDKLLAARARQMDPDSFRAFARGEIIRQREELIADEEKYAAADRLLSADDKKLITQMAMPRYRQQLITEAGGSVEQAKQKAREQGQEFDEMLEQERRVEMWQLLNERKVKPRIQVSAADMREYYLMHVNDYTQRSQAQFRVIKIDPARIGGDHARDDALARIKAIREKAVNGTDFASLASAENQDDYLKNNAGDPGGWLEKGAYRIDAIDNAIWQLQPGQVTKVIEDSGAFYIAKLEARKDGRVQPFEDQQLQDRIRAELSRRQFVQLSEAITSELEAESVVRRDDALLDSAVDMAMQKYAQWAQR